MSGKRDFTRKKKLRPERREPEASSFAASDALLFSKNDRGDIFISNS
jgi:hypothetical protein